MTENDPTREDLFHFYVELGFDDDFDFVGEDGQPIFMDYRTVDWQALSRGIRDLMVDLPESMALYVANEPIDVSDSNAEKQDDTGVALSDAMTLTFNLIESKDYERGVLNLAQYRHILHPIKFPADQAPPAIGLVMAVKATLEQLSDFEASVCRPFGHLPVIQTAMANTSGVERDSCIESMDPALHQLLVEHLQLPYKRQCAMNFMLRRPA